MKQLIQATLSIGLFLGSVSSADGCLWPFCGWWGAGYGSAPAYGYAPAPAYGSYTAGYPSWDAPVVSSYYSAGYASYAPATDCCVPSCCNACGSGSCVSGSCAGSTSYGTESLKPAKDQNFESGTGKEDEDYDRDLDRDRDPVRGPDRDRVKSPADDALEFNPSRRSKPNEPDPDDDFKASPMGEKNPGTDIPFELDGDQINNKPPMPDAKDLPAVDPAVDGTTFLPGESSAGDRRTQMARRQKSPAEQSSGLMEVMAPKRLASRSLPSSGSRHPTSWAGKSNDDKAQAVTPVRWISVPSPDGQVRL